MISLHKCFLGKLLLTWEQNKGDLRILGTKQKGFITIRVKQSVLLTLGKNKGDL